MKSKHLRNSIFAVTLLAGSGALMSNSGGITGRSTSGCGGVGCHSSAASTATMISITGIPGTGYVPGTTYALTLNVINNSKVAAGFDLKVNMGTLSVGSETGIALSSGATELRHTTPRTMTGGTSSWTFNWTAPATGTTPLTINVAGNAVNLDGSATSEDVWNTASLSFDAASVTGIATMEGAGISISPIPANDVLRITAPDAIPLSTRVIDMSGRTIAVSAAQQGRTHTLNVSSLSSGQYILVISRNGEVYSKPFTRK